MFTASTTAIQLQTPTATIQTFSGTFTTQNGTVTSGTIFDIKETFPNSGLINYEGTGFNIDLALYNAKVAELDSFGLRLAIYSGNDTLAGGPGNDKLLGFDGNDLVSGSHGDDELNGNQGNDQVYGGNGNDSQHGGQGNDFVSGDKGDDFATGSLGNDSVFGGVGDDYVYGGQGDDLVTGGEGNDYLSGDLGDDVLVGNDGRDLFAFRSNGGRDSIEDLHRAEGDQIGIQIDINGSGIHGFADLAGHFVPQADGTSINLGAGNFLLVKNRTTSDLAEQDFFFF
ncbi:MAG: calcium-binding protein [Alphaproteobacteria bacterium]|nr:calcium-binding protein [Alphaproteobacteria bacterium]